MLAIGQIGWASINIELGGKSLSYIFSSPIFLVIGLYAILLVLMGILDLYKMGIVKLFVTISSLILLGYVFISKFTQVLILNFLLHQPTEIRSLFLDVSIVVASLISFSTVTPNFFQNIKNPHNLHPSGGADSHLFFED